MMSNSKKHEKTPQSNNFPEKKLSFTQQKVVDSLPEEFRSDIVRVIKEVSYSGPIPSSYMLRDYEDVLKESANRILCMAEDVRKDRQSNTRRGQWMGFETGSGL